MTKSKEIIRRFWTKSKEIIRCFWTRVIELQFNNGAKIVIFIEWHSILSKFFAENLVSKKFFRTFASDKILSVLSILWKILIIYCLFSTTIRWTAQKTLPGR